MSVSLNKRIGYGYSRPRDLSEAEPWVNQESFLINEDNYLFDSSQDAWHDLISFEKEWAEGQRDLGHSPIVMSKVWLDEITKKDKRLPSVYDAFHRSYDEFEPDQDIVVIAPFMMIEPWIQRNNAFDLIEEQVIRKEYDLKSLVHTFDEGVYPFHGSYMRKDTLERFSYTTQPIMEWIRLRNATRQDGKTQRGLDILAQELGFASHDQANALIIPRPADEAVAFALWAKIFVNERDAYTMETLYYKYWS
jgi:hypothetical protein